MVEQLEPPWVPRRQDQDLAETGLKIPATLARPAAAVVGEELAFAREAVAVEASFGLAALYRLADHRYQAVQSVAVLHST